MLDKLKSKLTSLQKTILEHLISNPEGLTIYELREKIPDSGVQQHLDRRVRDLRKYFDISTYRRGKYTVYKYVGVKSEIPKDDGKISTKLRAKVLHKAHGRCQMCGKTVSDDNIKLQIDHRIPHSWGGLTAEENLWALCELCNGGKRDFFASFDENTMKQIVAFDTVYERLAATLKLTPGKPVPS